MQCVDIMYISKIDGGSNFVPEIPNMFFVGMKFLGHKCSIYNELPLKTSSKLSNQNTFGGRYSQPTLNGWVMSTNNIKRHMSLNWPLKRQILLNISKGLNLEEVISLVPVINHKIHWAGLVQIMLLQYLNICQIQSMRYMRINRYWIVSTMW